MPTDLPVPVVHRTLRPRKAWGQHFLIDGNIRDKILDAAQIAPGSHVVEIGPGRGILTLGLLARGARVSAIEVDPRLVAALKERPLPPSLNLIQADALRYPYAQIAGAYKVVANLPYYLSTPLLFCLLAHARAIPLMVLMLQREVAARLRARVGDADYGALSVLLQCRADVALLFDVARDCFRPRPKVDSSVVRITPLPGARVEMGDEAHFARVVKAAFAHRRKCLANSLSDAGFDREAVRTALQGLGVDPMRRGESLSLPEFARLAAALPISEK